MNNKGVISIFLFIAVIIIGLGVLSFFKTVQKQIPKVEVESTKGVSVLGIDIPLPKLKITPPSPQPSPTSSPKASSSPLTSPSQTSSPTSSPSSSPGSSPTSSPRSSPSSSPSITPSPTPSPPSSSKKFTCDFNTFETLFDGADPNLVKAGNQWLIFYTKQDFSVNPATTNIHFAYLPAGASLSAPKNQWSAITAAPLVPFNPNSWDDEVTETASFVAGWTPKRISDSQPGYESRIYYVGSSNRASSLKIGFLYRNEADGKWYRYSSPVLSGTEWWEKSSPPSAGEFGEPSMVYERGSGSQGENGTWHMYYQTCSNGGSSNGQSFTHACLIGHRTSSDGLNWSAPLGAGGKSWISQLFALPISSVPVTLFGKPEVRIGSGGLIEWIGGDDSHTVRYGSASNLNSDITHNELLFNSYDCKQGRPWCNWKLAAGHTYGYDSDGSLWVYFNSQQCTSGPRDYTDNTCPGGSAIWHVNRIKCNKS